MDIQGLQKMTLLDWPGKVACTVFLGGCDFRCPFCHNSELLSGPMPILMDQEGLLEFLRKRQGLLDGVCVTGGEPLLRPGLPGLLDGIKNLGFPVKLDTNGNHPDRLVRLWEQGLVDYVAMDVKNSPERYPETVGVPGLDLTPVRDSVAGCWKGMWSTSSAPLRCGSSMTRPPSRPSAAGFRVPDGTTSRTLWTGIRCCGPACPALKRRSWRHLPVWCGPL